MQNSIPTLGIFFLCLIAVPSMAQTVEEDRVQWSIGTDVSYYKNIELLPDGGDDETVLTTPVVLILAGLGTRYEGSLFAAGQYVDYFGNIYPDEVVRGAAGNLTLHVVPEVLDWSFIDNYGPFSLDPLTSDTPDNRAYVNYFQTGPTLTIGGNGRTRVVFDGSYARSNYSSEAESEGTEDLEYWFGDLALVRELGSQSALSIHGAANRTSPLNDSAADSYDIYDGYLRYEATGGRTGIKMDAGVTRLEYAGDSQSAPLFLLELERRLSGMVVLSMSGASGYGDSAASFARLQDDAVDGSPGGVVDGPGVDETQDLTALNAPQKETYANASLTLTGRLTTIAVGAGYYREDFESDSDLSLQHGWEYSMLVSRRITDSLDFSVGAERATVDYESADQNDKYIGVDAVLTWRFGRALSLVGHYEWEQQDSNVSDQNYTTSSIGVGIYYGFNTGPVGALTR